MKKLFVITFFWGALLSCNKQHIEKVAPIEEMQDSKLCELHVKVSSDLVVKSVGEATAIATNEKLIKGLQVFVFRGDFLDAYKSSNSSSLTVTCTAGDRTIYAVVNASDLSSISSKSALESQIINLNANQPNNLVMVGKDTKTLPASNSVNISVKRLVSRIVVKEIFRNFESASLAALPFSIKRIFVSDAAGDVKLASTYAPTIWYNTAGEKGELPSLLSDTVNANVSNNASYSTVHYFYTYPNPNSSKTTKLVVEAQLGTQTFYYPVSLPALESNKSYEFKKITIMRPGADDPSQPITSSDISFSVNVVDWVTTSIEEVII